MISPLQMISRDGLARTVETLGQPRGTRQATAAATSENAEAASASPSAVVPSGLAMKETFLTLLVAQIKNQNPLNPADGTEFLSQLAQFTQVEQLISIRQELETMGKQNQTLSLAAVRGNAAR